MKLKFGLMFRVKSSIGGNEQHQTENDAQLQRRFIFRINPRIKSSTFENSA